MLELDQVTFTKEIESKELVLVDFGAPWCPPCRIQEPILQELEKDYGNRMVMAKVDADEEPDLAARYGIMGLPTLLLFKNGELMETLRGLQSKDHLSTQINRFL